MLVRVIVLQDCDEPTPGKPGGKRALFLGQQYDVSVEALDALGDSVEVVGDLPESPSAPATDDLAPVTERMTVDQLRTTAAARGIDISGLRRKAEIVELINAA